MKALSLVLIAALPALAQAPPTIPGPPCLAGSHGRDGRLIEPMLGCAVQTPAAAWSGYGHDAHHTALSAHAAQALNSIHWQTPVDLGPPASGSIFIHYGSPIVTAGNTVIVPVKALTAPFELRAFSGSTGAPLYTLSTDYTLPAHNWTPPYAPVLAQGSKIFYPGAGGTVLWRNQADSVTGQTGRIAFYGNALYEENAASFNNTVQISTPLTADASGNIYFGFTVTGANPANLQSGIARIAVNGTGIWTSAVALTGDAAATQIALNCAPALSNDQQTVYIATSNGQEFGSGYLASLSAATLTPLHHVQLFDPQTGNLATISTDSSAAPAVGSDGDVYYGVLENPCCGSHNDRGWLLHFNSTLSVSKAPGSFGWDDTASILPSSIVASYHGSSSYLLLMKYNNYAGVGTGDGINKIAVLDPAATQQDEYATTLVTVMKEVITVTGPTHNSASGLPNAVYEWCINTGAVDPVTAAAIINSEDGTVYRWDFATNSLLQRVKLTSGRSEAYTPTVIGADGTVYAINDGILFAVGQ